MLIGQDIVHRVRRAHRRSVVMVRVPLQRESGGGVPREGLESRMGSPRWARSERHECRRSWKRMGGRPARERSGL